MWASTPAASAGETHPHVGVEGDGTVLAERHREHVARPRAVAIGVRHFHCSGASGGEGEEESGRGSESGRHMHHGRALSLSALAAPAAPSPGCEVSGPHASAQPSPPLAARRASGPRDLPRPASPLNWLRAADSLNPRTVANSAGPEDVDKMCGGRRAMHPPRPLVLRSVVRPFVCHPHPFYAAQLDSPNPEKGLSRVPRRAHHESPAAGR